MAHHGLLKSPELCNAVGITQPTSWKYRKTLYQNIKMSWYKQSYTDDWWIITVKPSCGQISLFMIWKWLKSIHFLSQHEWASWNNKPLLATYLVCAAGPRSIPANRWLSGSLGDSREVGLGDFRAVVWQSINQVGVWSVCRCVCWGGPHSTLHEHSRLPPTNCGTTLLQL